PQTAPARTSTSARIRLLESKLVGQGEPPELVARLVETIESADDLTLMRLRPYALADIWHVPRRDALELCLRATRAGLLDLRWELLCPLCRGAKASHESLADVRSEVHCDSCNIDFTVNFDRSVEVVFRANPSVRRIEARDFCVGGPQVTPHIVAQQLLAPAARREFSVALAEGRYRLRTHGLPGARYLNITHEGEPTAMVRAENSAWPAGELCLSTSPRLELENATDGEQLFILERTAWSDQAATAAEVTSLQLFRDLFADEALRPGDRISVGSLTILFTDLRSSTRLYREIGDAVAFGAVMNHFDVLRAEIAGAGGALIKTLGDAVMASFPNPAPALIAIMRAQAALASPDAKGARPLTLKAGIHTGPCIAVTLNGRLDYFGSNVNIAARLEPLSNGDDCVISSEVRHDPEVAALLSDPEGNLFAEQIEAELKGFDMERFELWRVRRKAVE
ncbi:MAG: DUF5939 domain-containing protein, partial [Pyrinomonadaceae bacterium]